MVEVALALAVLAFALVGVVALLPLGVESNKVSAEETGALALLSALQADLANTHPALKSGRSLRFDLPLPFREDAGKIVVNDTLTSKSVADEYSIPVDESGKRASGRSRYQISVVYLSVPAAGSYEPVQARLIVNWPSVDLSRFSGDREKILALTDTNRVAGFVETLIAFPAP